jgi:homoserine kinase
MTFVFKNELMKIQIKVPATSANLGPGFDALGLALDLWNESMFELADDFSVQLEGEGKGKLHQGKNNLIIRAAMKLAERAGKQLPPFVLHCINNIPTGAGLGSSAAAILTGLLAGNALLENPFSQEEILNLASEMEGHPDNVAPALLGGLVVSTIDEGKVIARQIPIGINLCITIALPDFYLPTKQARAALPRKVSVKNAVHNISRAVLVTEAFRNGDLNLLGKAMNDKLHQPYRLKLIPGASAAMGAAKEAGASAVALSGAGPSLIAFSSQAEAEIPQGDAIGESMKRAFEEAGLTARIFHLKGSGRGAEIQKLAD